MKHVLIFFLCMGLLFTVESVKCIPKTSMLVGAYIPQCNDDGSWVSMQCHGSIGFCWCVNDEGDRL